MNAGLRFLAALLVLLAGCARIDDDPICRPGERRCQEGTSQFCDDRGRWSVPEICPAGTTCIEGTCAAACGDACRPGQKRCSPSGPQACARNIEGCGEWSAPEPCGLGERCENGACITDCPIACEADQTRCVGPDAFVICDASDTCPKWTNWQGCPPDEEGNLQICTGGSCHAAGSCADQCREGEIVCLTQVQSQICARTAEGCLDWAAPLDCPADQRCREGQGCGAACQDECDLDAVRCAEGGRQACLRGPTGCAAWGPVEACRGVCVDGECEVEMCQSECEPGAIRCGPEGGVQTCEEADGCGRWGAEVPCGEGQSCAGAGVCGVCDAGQEEAQGCGNCGTQRRICGENGQWGEWGACENQGECVAGAEEACGRCGVRHCSNECRWGACENEGVCTAGETRACGNCGRETCNAQCQWGGCEGQGVCAPGEVSDCNECGHRSCTGACQWEGCGNGDGTLWRRCNDCGWQFCCPNGDWCNCAAHFGCASGSCVGAGVCQ